MTLAGAAAAFAVGAAVFWVGFWVGFATGFAGAEALGFAFFLSDLGSFGIVEGGDGLTQKEKEGKRPGLGQKLPNFRSAKLHLFRLVVQEESSREDKSLTDVVHDINKARGPGTSTLVVAWIERRTRGLTPLRLVRLRPGCSP